jgi:hypothetical protein
MPAQPVARQTWKPEDLAPLLEEQATVLAWARRCAAPSATSTAACWCTLRAGEGDEHLKYFAPGIGEVLEHYPEESFVLAGVAVLH